MALEALVPRGGDGMAGGAGGLGERGETGRRHLVAVGAVRELRLGEMRTMRELGEGFSGGLAVGGMPLNRQTRGRVVSVDAMALCTVANGARFVEAVAKSGGRGRASDIVLQRKLYPRLEQRVGVAGGTPGDGEAGVTALPAREGAMRSGLRGGNGRSVCRLWFGWGGCSWGLTRWLRRSGRTDGGFLQNGCRRFAGCNAWRPQADSRCL